MSTKLYQINHTKELKNESRLLSYYDNKLLTQIRMGYMQTPFDDWGTQPLCDCNDSPLTVQHFLVECDKDDLKERRNELKDSLIEIEEKYNDKLQYLMDPNATNEQKQDIMKYLLFPHLLYTTNELKHYNIKLTKMQILKLLIYYCRYRFPD